MMSNILFWRFQSSCGPWFICNVTRMSQGPITRLLAASKQLMCIALKFSSWSLQPRCASCAAVPVFLGVGLFGDRPEMSLKARKGSKSWVEAWEIWKLGKQLVLTCMTIIGMQHIGLKGWTFSLLPVQWRFAAEVFANIFAFTDAPNKRRAAKLVSRWLTIKHAAEIVLLPLVVSLGDETYPWFLYANQHMLCLFLKKTKMVVFPSAERFMVLEMPKALSHQELSSNSVSLGSCSHYIPLDQFIPTPCWMLHRLYWSFVQIAKVSGDGWSSLEGRGGQLETPLVHDWHMAATAQ